MKLSSSTQQQHVEEPTIQIPKKRQSQATPTLKNHWKVGSQVVDPNFNSMNLKFKTVVSNLEALFHSCETYKQSMQSFLFYTINVTESFRQMLEETIKTPQATPNILSQSPININPRTSDIWQHSDLNTGSDEGVNRKKIDILRLNKQLCVVAKRIETDMVFFESSVQKPINFLILVCSNISRTIASRENANIELSAIYDKIVRGQQSQVPTSKRSTSAEKLSKKLSAAKEKYETLNSILKNDLNIFLATVSSEFMREWFKNFYFTTLRISYSLHYFCWNCPEFKKLLSNQYPTDSGCYDTEADNNIQDLTMKVAEIAKKFQSERHYVSELRNS